MATKINKIINKIIKENLNHCQQIRILFAGNSNKIIKESSARKKSGKTQKVRQVRIEKRVEKKEVEENLDQEKRCKYSNS